MKAGHAIAFPQTPAVSTTLRGAFLIGASFLMVVLGIFLINGPLFTFGLGGFLLSGLAVLWGKRNLSHLQIHLQAPPQVFAGAAFDLHLSIENQRRFLDAFDLKILLTLADSTEITAHSPWTASRSSSTLKTRTSVTRRGAYHSHLLSLQSSFPLGLFSFTRPFPIPHDMLVFPKPLTPREFSQAEESQETWTGLGHQVGDPPGELRSLRPFRPGDRPKHWHWPATLRSFARGRSPRVREFEPPSSRPASATLIFHSFGTDHTLIRTDLFERALSLTVGTLRHLRSLGIKPELLADFFDWNPLPASRADDWNKLLVRLAHAQRAHSTEAHDLQSLVSSFPKKQALIVLSDMPPASWSHLIDPKNVLIIDIQQHRFSPRSLKTSRPFPTPPTLSPLQK